MTSPTASDTSTTATSGGKRSKAPMILGALTLALAAWGGKTVLYNRTHITTDNAQVDGTIVPVLAKVGGYVTTVRVAENQPVKGGDVLVQVDPSEYAVRLAQSDAEFAAAVAAAGSKGIPGQADAAVRTAEAQRYVVDAQIQSARAANAKAVADLTRLKELVAKQIVSKQAVDAAQAAVDETGAALSVAQRQAATAAAQVSGAEAGAKFAQARLAAARAARDNAALQLAWARVTSPVTGSVSRKQVEVGQLVQAGQPLLTIVSDTSVFVTANFKETQLATLQVGQAVLIEVDSYSSCAAEGKVESVSAATGARFALLPPDNSTGNFTKVVQRVPVRIQVTKGCGTGMPMRPGMSVVVHVVTS